MESDRSESTASSPQSGESCGNAASHHPENQNLRELTMDQAVEHFLTEYLHDEKGRAEKTISDYRKLHARWFSPVIGSRRVNRVDTATMDRLFAEMRQAGLSTSRMNQAKSLYAPFFRWAKRRGMTTRDPMADFEKPASTYLSRQRTPPEIEELSLVLAKAVETVPDIATLLVLGAVTGMRRGELVGIRRSNIAWDTCRITVDSAISESKQVKGTKSRQERNFHVDPATIAMLRRHCDEIDARTQSSGTRLIVDPFLFSHAADCSQPIPPDYFTKQVGILKGHLGIEEKCPEIIKMEDEALRLRRLPPQPRPAVMTGPAPKGGASFRQIGERFERSERWAILAVQAAELREQARDAGLGKVAFDGSIIALRKFTSSELLDAGFNISMVAQRQGHGPQVLTCHYSKSRASADKKAADHLGRVVHGRGGNLTRLGGRCPSQSSFQ
jgi:integrase